MATQNLGGTYVEKRIKDLVGKQSTGKTYDRRSKDQEEDLVTQEMIDFVAKECQEVLLFFGYANLTSQDKGYIVQNPSSDQKKLFGQYKESNRESIAWYVKDKKVIDNTFHDFDVSQLDPTTSQIGALSNIFLPKLDLFEM
mmetsp:Transcript_42482/g.40725  ORF Transcript_42482/g.40725 Transcript_42482/m.40725 type:complete len:141 (+) Transcript_42482:1024-1446(+)